MTVSPWATETPCHRLGDVGSTGDEALRLADDGAPLPFWVTARRQLAGRGRLGSVWVSEAGNLYVSLLVAQTFDLAVAAQLPLVAALAAYDAIAAVLGSTGSLSIKWPNDILLDGRKIAGILAESKKLADDRPVIVIGFGINCAHHPANTRYASTNLLEHGCQTSPEMLFHRLQAATGRRLLQWAEGTGFASIRGDWCRRAAGIGEPVEVRFSGSSQAGIFDRLDTDGRLVLRQPTGELLVSAGELFFPPPEAEPAR